MTRTILRIIAAPFLCIGAVGLLYALYYAIFTVIEVINQ